jgi:septum formation protein
MKIILASSSPYRKQLLGKIINQFTCDSPDIDEPHLPYESFENMAERLSIEKAKALQSKYPNSLIIGSDQVACIKDQILRKPVTKEKNLEQLKICQGKTAYFYTGLCLLNTQTGKYQSSVEHYATRFRSLSDQQLINYIEREKPFNCAGGFKMEGLGISLFEAIEGQDPNILIGLPLIRLIDMLENEGISVL